MLPLEELEIRKDLYKNIRYNHNTASVKVATIIDTDVSFCLVNEMVTFSVYKGAVHVYQIKFRMKSDACKVCKELFEGLKFISWDYINSFKSLEEIKCILSFYIELNEILDEVIEQYGLTNKLKWICDERVRKYRSNRGVK